MQSGSSAIIGETGSAKSDQGGTRVVLSQVSVSARPDFAGGWHIAWIAEECSLFDSVIIENLWSRAPREAGGCP